MLGRSTVGCRTKDFEDKRYATVIGFGRAHNCGSSSTVNCLIARREAEGIRVYGIPFRLLNGAGLYIWQNDELREQGIDEGSVIEIHEKSSRFLSNSGQRMDVREVLHQLKFGGGDCAVAHRGISEAFPNAQIATKGIYQNWAKPCPPYALISVQAAIILDDRILAITRLGEAINLNNRSRGTKYKQGGVNEVKLQVRQPNSESDVGDVILVTFGSRTEQNKFQAICEGILLLESSCSSSAEPLEMMPYPMSQQPRGICLIINNLCFENDQDHRFGAEYDEEALHALFKDELHFEVQVRNDLTNCGMQQTCEEFAAMDHSDSDAFVCIIMSHGYDDHIQGINGKTISLENVMSDFYPGKCQSLAGKPKVFIIQACRGTLRDELQPSNSGSADNTMAGFGTDSTLCRSTSTKESDFLLAFSTAPGYLAHREEGYGSLFIQNLVEVIRQYHKSEHLLDMLTIVTNRLTKKGRQVPAPVNTLRHKLYL